MQHVLQLGLQALVYCSNEHLMLWKPNLLACTDCKLVIGTSHDLAWIV